MRILETAEAAEKQPEVPATEKLAAWAKVLELYAKTPDAKVAEKHMQQIRGAELKRLGAMAEEVEKSRAQKVDRVRAWRALIEWSPKSPEAKAAERRMTALQTQLFQEAQDLDRIRRVDAETKLTAWRDARWAPDQGPTEAGGEATSWPRRPRLPARRLLPRRPAPRRPARPQRLPHRRARLQHPLGPALALVDRSVTLR
jgi:hypothetical protein